MSKHYLPRPVAREHALAALGIGEAFLARAMPVDAAAAFQLASQYAYAGGVATWSSNSERDRAKAIWDSARGAERDTNERIRMASDKPVPRAMRRSALARVHRALALAAGDIANGMTREDARATHEEAGRNYGTALHWSEPAAPRADEAPAPDNGMSTGVAIAA